MGSWWETMGRFLQRQVQSFQFRAVVFGCSLWKDRALNDIKSNPSVLFICHNGNISNPRLFNKPEFTQQQLIMRSAFIVPSQFVRNETQTFLMHIIYWFIWLHTIELYIVFTWDRTVRFHCHAPKPLHNTAAKLDLRSFLKPFPRTHSSTKC